MIKPSVKYRRLPNKQQPPILSPTSNNINTIISPENTKQINYTSNNINSSVNNLNSGYPVENRKKAISKTPKDDSKYYL